MLFSSAGQTKQSEHTASSANTSSEVLKPGKVLRNRPSAPVPTRPIGMRILVEKRSARNPPTTKSAVATIELTLSSVPISVWLRLIASCMGT